MIAGEGASRAALICYASGRRYPADDPRWRCDSGELLDLEFTAQFPIDEIRRRPPTMWRYREALPLADSARPVTFGEGCTPLACTQIRGVELALKLDSLLPTGSFKDRGASMLVSHARAIGISEIIEDSSGNAGAAFGAYAARAGIRCEILAPTSTSPAKLAQIRLSGAALTLVPGTRADTAAEALRRAQTAYYASHSWNPYFMHGTKTCAYEIAEELGWLAPDSVVVPVGNGTLLLGLYLGFSDLLKAGVINRMPRLVAAQARACAPIVDAFLGSGPVRASSPQPSVAEGISVAGPVRGNQCVTALRATAGTAVAVGETEITRALADALRAGFFMEPTCATALSAALSLDPAVRGRICVVVVTGHGLKAVEQISRLVT